MVDILQPDGWAQPRGYANGTAATGRLVFVAGQIGWDANQKLVSEDFVAQFRQILLNTLAVLSEADAQPTDVVRMTWYVLSRSEYLERAKEVGVVYRELMGKHFPAMAVVEVSALMEEGAKIEIETTAVIQSQS